ncbi:hypothetical protein [Spirosoma pollinicola]|uniref:Nuclear transport factor 2 family protein n=1 Tax=Spirosoma pollinicola TaxID=2057025 RepID=A0A2K8Z6Q1_9BACT|nr:hypothetical protein [Spirosoma pollinicola]AUD05566.1 hypothetical protein CWM47_29220 [Spirosoma pollinicola]
MSNTIQTYASAVEAGHIQEIAATFSTAIKVMPPGANQPNEGKEKTSMMLSTVAAVIDGYKLIRTYDAGDNWHTLLLEGSLDGTSLQIIDQVHIDENDLIDHVDIFLRPAFLAESLLGKVTEEIKKRMA